MVGSIPGNFGRRSCCERGLPELLRVKHPTLGVVSTSSISGNMVPEPYDPNGGEFLGVTVARLPAVCSSFCNLRLISSDEEDARIGRNGGEGVGMRGSAVYGKIISGFVRVGDGGPDKCLSEDCDTIFRSKAVACSRASRLRELSDSYV